MGFVQKVETASKTWTPPAVSAAMPRLPEVETAEVPDVSDAIPMLSSDMANQDSTTLWVFDRKIHGNLLPTTKPVQKLQTHRPLQL
eukprot:NODE_2965_length_391_cov_35.730994_g2883_i0.p1 GENE.NODE_2965_length_391_cov_35.730994_g2883_i0~~NODE_2965_length_391_cov_35.730994_g2883_i0.p1  ORF type:complete len:95 (-),score=31.12 NODE_2965_length_391_cov_35.730994_g2883_i0:106-363(-)